MTRFGHFFSLSFFLSLFRFFFSYSLKARQQNRLLALSSVREARVPPCHSAHTASFPVFFFSSLSLLRIFFFSLFLFLLFLLLLHLLLLLSSSSFTSSLFSRVNPREIAGFTSRVYGGVG